MTDVRPAGAKPLERSLNSFLIRSIRAPGGKHRPMSSGRNIAQSGRMINNTPHSPLTPPAEKTFSFQSVGRLERRPISLEAEAAAAAAVATIQRLLRHNRANGVD